MRCLLLVLLLVAAPVLAQPLGGSLTIAGSDTLASAVARAAESFNEANSGVRIQLQTLGSASAAAALLEGAVDIGAMSRGLEPAEAEAFAARQKPLPRQLAIARDALVVIVHPDNPLRQMSMQDIDAVFAAEPRCGSVPMTHWNQLIANDERWAGRAILPIGRNAASGTHRSFQRGALCSERFRANVVEWPGNGAVILAVSRNREAIGYASAGSVDASVRALALTDADGSPYPMDAASLRDGRYPLARELFLVANRDAQGRLRPLTAAFMRHLLSDEGQAGLRHQGFQTLSADERQAASAALH